MSAVSLQDLLEAGTHFGHQTKRWNPKMKRYILCSRNGIYIVDLNKTLKSLDKFLARVTAEIEKGGRILFVGTKKQVKDCIREEASRCGMPYVCERWLGGMLTNFKTIKQSIAKLEKIEKMETDGTMEALPKKEVLSLMKKKEKLLSVLEGIRHMRKQPTMIFIVDAIKEHIAIDEARRLRIPIGAIVDTNCDPDAVDYPIPGNDDAIKSVQLITSAVADAVLAANPQVGIEEMADATDSDGTDITDDSLTDAGSDDSDDTESSDDKPATKKRVVRRKMKKDDESDD